MPKKAKKEKNVANLKSYSFPTLGKTVEAATLEEATAIALGGVKEEEKKEAEVEKPSDE